MLINSGYDPYEEAKRELDNFVDFGIDMGEKDHEKFFIERYIKIRDLLDEKVRDLEATVEDLESARENMEGDLEDYDSLQEDYDRLREGLDVLENECTVVDRMTNKELNWKEFKDKYVCR